LQIIFHKRAIKYRSLLQKMTLKDKGSYKSSPPCRENEKVYVNNRAKDRKTETGPETETKRERGTKCGREEKKESRWDRKIETT